VGGYDAVLQNMGLLIGVGILAGAVFLRDPPTGWPRTGSDGDEAEQTSEDCSPGGGAGSDEEIDPNRSADGGQHRRQYGWREMLRTWQFWVMYAMFVAVSGAGLMLTAKIVSFAGELGLAATIATLSATLLPVAGGVGRLLLGEVSDRVPRTKAMAAAFTLCGVGLVLVVVTGRAGFGTGFVAAVVAATFFWSPQYTLFPSLVGDYYGEKHSSANYALVYSGKVWGGVFGGAVTGWIITVTSWTATFVLGGCLAIAAGIAALVLRPPEDCAPP
jgi:OFA family oxalate/formate antiporter-like MFS transporter